MRRAAHLVASILLVVTTVGQSSVAFSWAMRVSPATDPGGIADVVHSTPVAAIARELVLVHASASRVKHAESIAIAGSTVRSAGLGFSPYGWQVTASTRYAFELEAAHGRAPPLSR